MNTPTPKAATRPQEAIRRELRIVLNKARLGKELTQKAVADQLDWSSSKIVRIESGQVPVAPSDVKLLLGLYGQHQSEEIDKYFELAKQSREAPNWSDYEDIMSLPFREYVAQEPFAAKILKYEHAVVPGVLQIEDYAYDLFTALGHTGEQRSRRMEIRDKRRPIAEADEGPDISAVIDESALLRPVGGIQTMRAQVNHLIDLSQKGRISLYLLTHSAGVYPGVGKEFTILEFEDSALDVVYLEDANEKSSSEETPELLGEFRQRHERLVDLADKNGFEDLALQIRDQHYGK